MKLSMYSIYDKVACVFNKPFTDINDASAMRSFKQACHEQPHSLDYELYHIADFTDHDGYIIGGKGARKLMTGFDVKQSEPHYSDDVADLSEVVPAVLKDQAS